jgi:hypothetical protein
MDHQTTMKILWPTQLLTVKSRILESLPLNVDIVTHCYGMKKDLDPTDVLRIRLLESAIKMERLIYQNCKNFRISLNNF